ncbi:L-histidine N(alpha)-methyltransferase [Limnohabitans sp.]|uniref:L-histidine N(alpha)-methyltransferase n=1 Tax=Limnohabitans sp. TaxID=1907725 RepID=UPI00333F23A8
MQDKQPLLFDIHQENKDANVQELIQGLLCTQAILSPKYFYDELGSVLFDAITLLPEYYPTRTELQIFTHQASEIHAHFPKHATWIDLGAGSCQKAVSLFSSTMPATYVAVDISVEYLTNNLRDLQAKYAAVSVVGIGMDFSNSLTFPAALQEQLTANPILALYLGSSLGNFNPTDAFYFLQRIADLCKTGQPGSGLIIGIDLVKDVDTLERAYADDLGVTAAFNLNVLRRVNSLLGSDFDLLDWQHIARFNVQESRVEMHLQAKRDLVVNWQGHQRHFKKDETIHTENSYKWTIENFSSQLIKSGFSNIRHWTDTKSHYALFWAS